MLAQHDAARQRGNQIMSVEPASRLDAAIDEIKALLLARFPDATFELEPGEDPEGTWMTVTVDVDDTDEVFDVVVDRLVDMQVEEGIPLYVIPVRPIERIMADLHAPDPVWKRPLLPLG
jgi:hypothetical protein